jgi:HAD superfamily hydrolase (TIGR01450 family)
MVGRRGGLTLGGRLRLGSLLAMTGLILSRVRVALKHLPLTVGSMAIGGVLFDIDGVLVTSWQAIPGAAEALRVLADNQIARTYLTNTTTRTRSQIAGLLTDAGMEVAADEVITAAVLTAEYVRDRYPGARCFLVNSGQIGEDMPGVDVVYASEVIDAVPETPDVILLGGAGPEYNHVTLSRVYDWMAQGVPVVAMHRSTSWNTTEGLRIDTGMYLIGMEETSGRKATAVGKPAPEGFLASASRLGVDPDEMYMVGDDINNDVLAAQVVGMTGVLVRTGKFRQDTLDRWAADDFAMQPNHVIDSVADLPVLLGL